MFVVVFEFIFAVFAQGTTYYVATTGSESVTCGVQVSPCSTINRVLTNYPGASYTINIAAGYYALGQITLSGSAVVIFQGVGTNTITANWSSGSLISNTAKSGFEFHDLSLTLIGGGSVFSSLTAAGNIAGFYNILLICSSYSSGDFIDFNGGSLVISNLTLTGATFDSYFILDMSDEESTNVTITGSTFSNVTFGENGGLLTFDGYGDANVVLNGTAFSGISSDYVFIGLWACGDQRVSITNSVFNNTNTHLPSVYVENDYQCVINVQNTTWNNASADFVSGALETLGSSDGTDHSINLDNLKITNSSGPYAGALVVSYNSLNMSNCKFCGNHGEYADDVVHALDSQSSRFGHKITNSCSCLTPPQIVIWNLSTGEVTTIMDSTLYICLKCDNVLAGCTDCSESANDCYGKGSQCYYNTSEHTCKDSTGASTCDLSSDCSACLSSSDCLSVGSDCKWSSTDRACTPNWASTCDLSSDCSACLSSSDCLSVGSDCKWSSTDRACTPKCDNVLAGCTDCSESANDCYGKGSQCYYNTSEYTCKDSTGASTCDLSSDCSACLSSSDCLSVGSDCKWSSTDRACTPKCDNVLAGCTDCSESEKDCYWKGSHCYYNTSEHTCKDSTMTIPSKGGNKAVIAVIVIVAAVVVAAVAMIVVLVIKHRKKENISFEPFDEQQIRTVEMENPTIQVGYGTL